MKEGWEYKTLGECCRISDFVSNGSFASLKQNVNYYYAKNYALLVRLADNSNNFDESKFVYTDKHGYDFTSKSHLHGGEIIMSNVGSVGSVFICPDLKIPMTLAPNTISIDTEYNRFFYYLFISPSFSSILSEIVTKTTLKKFNKTNFKKLIVRVPNSLDEQRRIVSYLDSSFKLIDEIKNKALKSLTEAKALFQSALAEAMEPKEGWEEKILKNICKVINGRAYLKPEMLDEGKYRLLRVGNFFTNSKWYYTNLELEEEKYCNKGDLLYAWSASFGPKIWDGEKVVYHYHIWKIQCEKIIDKKFMYYWLDSNELKKQVMSNLHCSTMAHITKKIIEECNVSFPPLPTQKRIVSRLDKLSSKVRAIEEKYQKMVEECDALKQAMLRDVFE